jgi:hypothetical protein
MRVENSVPASVELTGSIAQLDPRGAPIVIKLRNMCENALVD